MSPPIQKIITDAVYPIPHAVGEGGALFMQKKKTIPLKLQLLRIHICKKTYNSWNIPDNESNSRQFPGFLVFQT